MSKLTGWEAIEYKKSNPDAELNKYNDPIEEERFDLSFEEAEDVAREDPSLIWAEGPFEADSNQAALQLKKMCMTSGPAVYIPYAECIGSGSDMWKRINGITKARLEEIEHFMKKQGLTTIAILVDSNTQHLNQKYKRAEYRGSYGWTHRQIEDHDFEIVFTVY